MTDNSVLLAIEPVRSLRLEVAAATSLLRRKYLEGNDRRYFSSIFVQLQGVEMQHPSVFTVSDTS